MNERLRMLMSELLELPPADVHGGMRRADTENWDSMNHLRLITAIEAEFGASFTMDEIAQVQTPEDLQHIIDARGAQHSSTASARM